MTASPYPLSPLELASGQILAPLRRRELPSLPGSPRPLDALTAVLGPALARPPCLVAFSGGRDSSLVLAAAAHAARQLGLPAPVPFTLRFRDTPESDESDWQELVVRHLGLDDWACVDAQAEEFHVLGPWAARVCRRHGILWPSNLHLLLPAMEVAEGGSLVTGAGGDEIFDGIRWRRTAAVLARERFPRPSDLRGLGYALAPDSVKRAAFRHTLRSFGTWLRPGARRRARAALAAQAATEPFAWADRLAWWSSQPYLYAQNANLAAIAADSDVEVFDPLVDPRFVASLARLPAEERYRNRTAALIEHFAGLLPEEVARRTTKATFNHIDAPGPRLSLLSRWNGEGVDEQLVDLEAIRREWSKPLTLPSTTPLLQAAWLALEASASGLGQGSEPLGRGREEIPAARAAELPHGQSR